MSTRKRCWECDYSVAGVDKYVCKRGDNKGIEIRRRSAAIGVDKYEDNKGGVECNYFASGLDKYVGQRGDNKGTEIRQGKRTGMKLYCGRSG